MKTVKNFSGGKYLIYTYNKSVKLRIQQVRGDNAVLSGIFFDPAPTSDTIPTDTLNSRIGEINIESPIKSIYLTSKHAKISFNVKNNADTIDGSLLDLLGRKTATLINGSFTKGGHQISRSLTGLTFGVYILQTRVNNKSVFSKKFLIEK